MNEQLPPAHAAPSVLGGTGQVFPQLPHELVDVVKLVQEPEQHVEAEEGHAAPQLVVFLLFFK